MHHAVIAGHDPVRRGQSGDLRSVTGVSSKRAGIGAFAVIPKDAIESQVSRSTGGHARNARAAARSMSYRAPHLFRAGVYFLEHPRT